MKSGNKHGNVFPSFVDVAAEVEKYINKSEYSDENKSNYKGSLLTHLESLTNGINSMIFSADDIDDSDLFDENVIVDLSRVGSMETKALIMGILILKLQEHRIACSEGSNSELRHVTVLEEAHNLLKRTSTEQRPETANLLGKSVEMLANSIAEMRTYGEGFIIADQLLGLTIRSGESLRLVWQGGGNNMSEFKETTSLEKDREIDPPVMRETDAPRLLPNTDLRGNPFSDSSDIFDAAFKNFGLTADTSEKKASDTNDSSEDKDSFDYLGKGDEGKYYDRETGKAYDSIETWEKAQEILAKRYEGTAKYYEEKAKKEWANESYVYRR